MVFGVSRRWPAEATFELNVVHRHQTVTTLGARILFNLGDLSTTLFSVLPIIVISDLEGFEAPPAAPVTRRLVCAGAS